MKYRDFIAILAQHGFKEIRTVGDHHQYEGFVGGQRRMVTAAYAHVGEDIMRRNLASMIRQSGLPKKKFR